MDPIVCTLPNAHYGPHNGSLQCPPWTHSCIFMVLTCWQTFIHKQFGDEVKEVLGNCYGRSATTRSREHSRFGHQTSKATRCKEHTFNCKYRINLANLVVIAYLKLCWTRQVDKRTLFSDHRSKKAMWLDKPLIFIGLPGTATDAVFYDGFLIGNSVLFSQLYSF